MHGNKTELAVIFSSQKYFYEFLDNHLYEQPCMTHASASFIISNLVVQIIITKIMYMRDG